MPSTIASNAFFLCSVIGVGLLAACGGGDATGPGPVTPGTASASASSMATPPSSATANASGSTAPLAVPPPAGAMKTPTASAFADDLKKIGLDPLKPPPMSKLTPDQVRKIMPTFAKSLGVKCDACHDVNNFKADTPNKKVAAGMWQHFVVDLALTSGEPLYCDSCHGGKQEFLDDHDKKALSAWMDANYVSKLKRTDKKDHGCETCHGDPFEPKFLKVWASK